MKNRRQLIFTLSASALAAPLLSLAQKPAKIWRFGFLDFSSRQSMSDAGRYAALFQGLREQGYVEGKNFVLEARYADADGRTEHLDALASDLVRQNPDLILSVGTPTSKALQRATTTIPIVVITTSDPVRQGLAASLARPGGNITGMDTGGGDTIKKLVELLIIAAPKLKRIAVLINPVNATQAAMHLADIQAAAKHAGRQVLPVSARTPQEIESGFAVMARERADAVIIPIDGLMLQQRAQIAALALKYRLPSIYPTVTYAEAGGLMSYGADTNDNFRRAGIFVNKILKGAKPGDIPFEQPTRYYCVINRKTAKALGVKLTEKLLLLADKVIE